MNNIGIIVARFQVAEINSGIRHVIHSVQKRHDRLIIVLGEAAVPGSAENPLPAEARKTMIQDAFPDLAILTLKDQPLDERWSESLDELIVRNVPTLSVTLYGNEERFVRRYTGKHAVEALPTSERKTGIVKPQFSIAEFRNGMVYAHQQSYAKVFPTVDVAVFRDGHNEILLGKKAAENKWRLIGGFVDPDDADFAAAAKRELQEECGAVSTGDLIYEGSFRIDDWRYRYEPDKIISTLFSAEYVSGEILPSDDIEEATWIALDALQKLTDTDAVASEHRPMLRHLFQKYLPR
jgi:bifunctional NMN adenylyltransferase/nudix hydrolase